MEKAPKESLQEPKIMIHIHDIYKDYGSLQVLKGLSLDVLQGETLVILGRSGVGKSVLLKQIISIEKPDRGYIEIEGERLADYSLKKRLQHDRRMGMLFQGSALFDSMNVGENTAFYLRQHEPDLPAKELLERVEHALSMVGLSNTQNKMPSDLSGGMRKRAALARVIIYRPRIILYDEPTTGLDPITAMQINDLIHETQEELKATSIVVTHDIRSAMEVSDRIAFHHDGKIASIAPRNQFFQLDDPLIQSFYSNAVVLSGQHPNTKSNKDFPL
jgi:phospholipid/cholesterol/gamma-HCH transport system ATP-binding protein